ncbi:MAG: hypothetical protein IT279_03335 [Ignavibacteriaceae bacterium]|nr:hypothetical protein [Ignavibacteriaceae bacterium]
MIWKCARCGKEFAKESQSHICENVDPELLFNGKEEQVYVLYLILLDRVEKKLKTIVTATSKSVTLYSESRRSFLVISPRRKFLDVWFALDKLLDEPWIMKTYKSGKTKYVHYVRISDSKQITAPLLRAITKAYKLVNGGVGRSKYS